MIESRKCAHCGEPFEVRGKAVRRRYCGWGCERESFMYRKKLSSMQKNVIMQLADDYYEGDWVQLESSAVWSLVERIVPLVEVFKDNRGVLWSRLTAMGIQIAEGLVNDGAMAKIGVEELQGTQSAV